MSNETNYTPSAKLRKTRDGKTVRGDPDASVLADELEADVTMEKTQALLDKVDWRNIKPAGAAGIVEALAEQLRESRAEVLVARTLFFEERRRANMLAEALGRTGDGEA